MKWVAAQNYMLPLSKPVSELQWIRKYQGIYPRFKASLWLEREALVIDISHIIVVDSLIFVKSNNIYSDSNIGISLQIIQDAIR